MNKIFFYLYYLIIVFNTVFPISIYKILPENIASHFDMNGNLNGSMNKYSYLFIMILLPIFLEFLKFLLKKNRPFWKKLWEILSNL